jgi:hypothetical protein
MPRRKTTRGLKKGKGMFANRMLLAALVGMIVIGGGFAAFYFMSNRDTITWNNATEVMRNRGVHDNLIVTTTTTGEAGEIDISQIANPVIMSVYGVDNSEHLHLIADSSPAQSAFIGELNITDIQFNITWNLVQYYTDYPETFSDYRTIQLFLSVVNTYVSDTYGHSYSDNTSIVYTDNVTIDVTTLVGYSVFSMVNNLYNVSSIDDMNALVVNNARANGAMINQALSDDNETITDVTGMLTFDYGILGFYMVDGLGSDANRALKRLTVTTEPVAPDTGVPPASAFAIYNIGVYQVSDTVLIIGMGVFAMILVFVYLGRRR